MIDRRRFLATLGLSTAALAALPLDELTDRLGFARSPTSSVYVRRPVGKTRGMDTLIFELHSDMLWLGAAVLEVSDTEPRFRRVDWISPNHAEEQRRRLARLDDVSKIGVR